MTGDDELNSLLEDPAVWAEPSPELEDRIVAAISGEVVGASPGAGQVTRIPVATRGAGNRWRYAVAGLAAAVVLLVGAFAVLARDDGTSARQLEVALSATDLAPGARGDATLTQTTSGWRIELEATGLDRLDEGRFYQAWLLDADGVGVSIGTFNEGEHVTLWAGVSPQDYPRFSITEELADGDQASSGRSVLTGTITPSSPGSG